jgi:hypothetical protein
MRTREQLTAIYLENAQSSTKSLYDGFTTEEISEWSRRLMFGENDEAFPSEEDWSAIVD